MKGTAATMLVAFAFSLACVRAQTPEVPSPEEVASALGFTSDEIAKIKACEILRKNLKEGSDKELAGVVSSLQSARQQLQR